MNALRKFRSLVTVEPCVAIYLVGMNVTTIANLRLLLDKTCRVNLAQPAAMCDNLSQQNLPDAAAKDLDQRVQMSVAHMMYVGKILQVIVPFVMVLLWGLWSDRNRRRKPLIILPIIGEVLRNACLVLCVAIPSVTAEVTFAVESFFPIVFGNFTVILLGIYSHVMDATTAENRTVKVAFSTVFVTIGNSVGTALCGILLE